MIDWSSLVLGPVIGVFGQPAVYTQAGTNYPLSGVFDEAYASVDVSSGQPVTTWSPCFGFNVSDLPVTPRQKDRLTITATGQTYIVRNVQPDGHGWCRLLLNLAPTVADTPTYPVQDA